MPNSQYYGYDFMSAQPVIRASLKIPVKGSLDLAVVDAWLEGPFAVDKSRLEANCQRAGDALPDRVRAVMDRAFVLYGEFMRAASVPVFEHGKLLRAAEDKAVPGLMDVSFLLPVVDNVSVPIFQGVLKEAVRLVLEKLGSPPDASTSRDLLIQLDKDVVESLKSWVPFNKTCLQVCSVLFDQGLPFRHVGHGLFKVGWGARSQLFNNASAQADSAVGARICHNKLLTTQVLSAAGYPAPDNANVKSADDAVQAARALGWPVVIKPTDRERSEGVTVNIRTEAATRLAYDRARKLSDEILIERHVPGTVHRIMVTGGKVIYVVRRLPKGVRGNGHSSISELVHSAEVERMRLPPWKRLKAFELDDLANACLKEQGHEPQSVPDAGEWVCLRPLAANVWGGEIEDLTKVAHRDNTALATDIAQLLGMTSTGVDIITTDITRPWHEVGAVVNEVNFGPQFTTVKREIYADLFVAGLSERGGRIPVHLVISSGDPLAVARRLKKRLKCKARKCLLTSATHTEDAAGAKVSMPVAGLFERSIALLLRPDVQELIIAASPNEIFTSGIAADQLESVWVEEPDDTHAKTLIDTVRQRFPAKSLRQIES